MPRLDPTILQAIRNDFIKGDTLSDCAKRYGVNYGSLKHVSAREHWGDKKTMIGQGRKELTEKIDSQVISNMVQKASLRVEKHLERVFENGSAFMSKLESNMKQAMDLPPTLDMTTALQLVTSYGKADGLVRRSLGLADTVTEVSVTGEVSHTHTLSVLQSCRALVDQGKDVPAVDVDALLIEAKGCDK